MHKTLSMDISQTSQKLERYHSLKGKNIMPSLYRWKKQGMVAHVRKGIYLPSDLQDKFRIACNAVEEGCLVYHAALEYYSLQTQEFNWLYVHSTFIFRTFTYQGESYVYKPVKFLYKPLIVDKDNPYPIRVTSINQTLIDCLYNINLAGGLEELLYAISELDHTLVNEKDMLHCLKLYGSKSLFQRAGFVLSHFKDDLRLSDYFFKACKEGMGKNISYLINPYYCNSFSKEWKLCIPANAMKKIQKDCYYEI